MTINFLIAPDFPPEYFAGWHFMNARLQKMLDVNIHLLLPANSTEEQNEIDQDKVDIIYANPFDAAKLIRELGYLAVVQPVNVYDEIVIASSAEFPIKKLDDVKKGMTVLATEYYDVKLLALRLLESVDIEEKDLVWQKSDSFAALANGLIKKRGHIGLFLASAYKKLTDFTRSNLTTLIESKIRDLNHVVLIHPRQATMLEMLQQAFCTLNQSDDGQTILDDLGLKNGFTVMSQEDIEFLIDIIETLRD